VDNPTGDGMVTVFPNGIKMVLHRDPPKDAPSDAVRWWHGSCGVRYEGTEGWVAIADGYKRPEVSDHRWLDEFAQMEPRIWSEVIRPALADRLGWAVFIGTPRGRNAFWKLYDRARRDKDWFTPSIVPRANLIGGKELAAAAEMSEEEYSR
jgi:hypothetical protein